MQREETQKGKWTWDADKECLVEVAPKLLPQIADQSKTKSDERPKIYTGQYL